MIVQVDIGLAQQVKSPKNLIRAHQLKDRKTILITIVSALFDNLDLRK